MRRSSRTSRLPRAFTLVEVLVSTAVLSLMLVMLISLLDQTRKIWQSTTTKIGAFQDARIAFESMTRNISQATLNTYYEYFDSAGRTPADSYYTTNPFTPSSYGRYSELHFITGPGSALVPTVNDASGGGYVSNPAGQAVFFHAPLGYVDPQAASNVPVEVKQLVSQLNAVGYFLEFANDKRSLPPMVTATNLTYRYRLTEFLQPTESLRVYSEDWTARTPYGTAAWFTAPLTSQNAQATHVMAQNIVALVIRPKRADAEEAALQKSGQSVAPLCKDYQYDSRPYTTANNAADATAKLQTHQLPPMVGVTMIAIDEPSAQRLAARYGNAAPMDQIDAPTGQKLSGLFAQTAVSTNDAGTTPNYNADLRMFVGGLAAAKVNYRVFDTEIIIRNSKWTEK